MTAPSVTTAPIRPAGVSAAVFMLSGVATSWLVAAIATLFAMRRYLWDAREAAQSPDAGSVVVLLLALFVGVAVGATVIAVLLAVFDARGSATARVLTWVYAAPAVGAGAVVLLADPFTGILWHHWLSIGVAGLTVAIVLVVAVLLALPPASRYFGAVQATRRAGRTRHLPTRYAPHPYAPYPPYPPPSVSPTDGSRGDSAGLG